MKKVVLSMLAMTTLLVGGTVVEHQVHADVKIPKANVSRVYNPNTGEHVYTPVGFEVVELIKAGWSYEGTAFKIPYVSSPFTGYPVVQRLYNPNAGDHQYTTNTFEVSSLVALGWKNDGVGVQFAVAKANTGAPVYRLYNPNAKVGSHHFTMSVYERDSLIKAGWKNEGVAFNAYSN
ncbi:hypothetical protein ACFO26_03375 [Lactococcus nasutitermitis]|uniref:DUF5648 domain-containing protein n=1 Tax=Lactococcus nasutitermitis TaxID=1652957 RepID=A0ABV9JCY2_9LACT|nr:hypothetical protein [Lactococcus nasutitermitis]